MCTAEMASGDILGHELHVGESVSQSATVLQLQFYIVSTSRGPPLDTQALN